MSVRKCKLTIGGSRLVPLSCALYQEQQSWLLSNECGGSVGVQLSPRWHGCGVGKLAIGVDVGGAPSHVETIWLIQKVDDQPSCIQ